MMPDVMCEPERDTDVLVIGAGIVGIVEEWCRGLAAPADGHARWRGHPTMTAVAKYLARDVEVLLERRVVALRRSDARWSVEAQLGEVFSAGAVVLTPPVPQSLSIIEAGGLTLDAETRARLGGIEYERCLAVMAVLSGPSRLAPRGDGFGGPRVEGAARSGWVAAEAILTRSS